MSEHKMNPRPGAGKRDEYRAKQAKYKGRYKSVIKILSDGTLLRTSTRSSKSRVDSPTSSARSSVIDMHTKNHLWRDVACSDRTLESIENDLLEIVVDARGDDRPILAGSTISFDLSFLRVHMPRLAARLHYRLYDVTSVKLFCQSLGMPKFPKAEAHRAMPDVLESIAHAKACAEWLARDAFKGDLFAAVARTT